VTGLKFDTEQDELAAGCGSLQTRCHLGGMERRDSWVRDAGGQQPQEAKTLFAV